MSSRYKEIESLMPLARSRAIACTLEAYVDGEPLPRPAWEAGSAAASAVGFQLSDVAVYGSVDKKQL